MSQVGERTLKKRLCIVEITEALNVSVCPGGGEVEVSDAQETERPKPAEDIIRRVTCGNGIRLI